LLAMQRVPPRRYCTYVLTKLTKSRTQYIPWCSCPYVVRAQTNTGPGPPSPKRPFAAYFSVQVLPPRARQCCFSFTAVAFTLWSTATPETFPEAAHSLLQIGNKHLLELWSTTLRGWQPHGFMPQEYAARRRCLSFKPSWATCQVRAVPNQPGLNPSPLFCRYA
jgi:hypothetical protein